MTSFSQEAREALMHGMQKEVLPGESWGQASKNDALKTLRRINPKTLPLSWLVLGWLYNLSDVPTIEYSSLLDTG